MDDGAQDAVVQWFWQQLKEFFVDGYTNLCVSGTPVSSPVVNFSNCCNTLILYAYLHRFQLHGPHTFTSQTPMLIPYSLLKKSESSLIIS